MIGTSIWPAYVRARHHYARRHGEWAEITGMRMVKAGDALYPRLCYQVTWPDDVVDYWPVHDEHADYQFSWGPEDPS